jgi:hypothetical protein
LRSNAVSPALEAPCAIKESERLFYPTYSDGGTPNCFLKEVEKWERVLKPVM